MGRPSGLTGNRGIPPFLCKQRQTETTTPRPTEAKNPESLAYAHWLTNTFADSRKALEATWEQMGKYADKHRAAPPTYRVRGLVML